MSNRADLDLQVVTVSQDMGDPGKVQAFLDQRGFAQLPAWLDPKGDLASHYGVQTLPTTIYYDALAAGLALYRRARLEQRGVGATAGGRAGPAASQRRIPKRPATSNALLDATERVLRNDGCGAPLHAGWPRKPGSSSSYYYFRTRTICCSPVSGGGPNGR
jgi:hypothetical protein